MDVGFTSYCTVDEAQYQEKVANLLLASNVYNQDRITEFNVCVTNCADSTGASCPTQVVVPNFVLTKPQVSYDYTWTSYSTTQMS